MGNSVLGDGLRADVGGGTITKFYSSQAWIDGRAEQQLAAVAGWPGVQRIAAFPDLHPGKYGPVGCAVLADRIYPQLIGNDIGCGMALFALDLPVRKLKLDKAMRRLRVLGEPAPEPYGVQLAGAGLPSNLYADALGTLGGGNHFCEVQVLAQARPEIGLKKGALCLLVHSGSRGFGNAVFSELPEAAFSGMMPGGAHAQTYLQGHELAVQWAGLNRRVIANRAAEALRAGIRLICDVPHNLLYRDSLGWVHRKGAAVALEGLVPLAGSRATASYLMRAAGHPDALGSVAHGAGRRYDRASMHGRQRAKRSDIQALQRNPYGGRILCEDRDLLIEESPLAYKSAEAVMSDLEQTDVARCVGELHPLLTVKAIRGGRV